MPKRPPKPKDVTSVATKPSLAIELARERSTIARREAMRKTLIAILIAGAIAAIAATALIPVLRIDGQSMLPTLTDGDIVLTARISSWEQGDIVAAYHDNDIIVKRVIATSGQWVDMDREGNVWVDGKQVDEPYALGIGAGKQDVEFPLQVPEGRIFVLGDNRGTSIDSRSTQIGCVRTDKIIGRLLLRIWPLDKIGKIA